MNTRQDISEKGYGRSGSILKFFEFNFNVLHNLLLLPLVRAKPPMEPPRLLYVDAYDSFARNIVALLEQAIEAEVTIITIDDPKLSSLSDSKFAEHIGSNYDGIVVGPGPGNPALPCNVGLIPRLWALESNDLVPVLGVCLGFQSMCLAFGGHVFHSPL